MDIKEETLIIPCKCGNTKADVHREDDNVVPQAIICTKCGKDLR